MPNCLMDEDRESIMMHLQNWKDAQDQEKDLDYISEVTSDEVARIRVDAKDALMGEIIRCGIANEVFIIDEVVLTELLCAGEEVHNDRETL